MSNTLSSPPYVSALLAEVEAKKHQRSGLADQASTIQKQLAEIDRWIDAALVVVGNHTSPIVLSASVEMTATATVSASLDIAQPEMSDRADMTAMLVRALSRSPHGLTHDEARAELRKIPDLARRLDSAPTYFYTLISRLSKRGDITKNGNRLVIGPRNSRNNSAPLAQASGAVNGSGT
jgi:hypothetical protein